MKLPRRHRIGPFWYKVKYKKGLKDSENEEVSGLCYFRKGKIEIDKELQGRMLASTVLHEDIHAALDAVGCFGLRSDESFVESMANAMLALLLDSPNYLEFLMEIRDEHK